MRVETFSEGKPEGCNEDRHGFNNRALVVADGVTSLTKRLYDGKSGGEIAAKVVVQQCIACDVVDVDLVQILTQSVDTAHTILSPDPIADDERFGAVFASARIKGDVVHLTYVGDVGIRINGRDVLCERLKVDDITGHMRSQYIALTGDVEGSRAWVSPHIAQLRKNANDPTSFLGYGVIDGRAVPATFVKYVALPREDVKTIELFSDGYYVIPQQVEIAAWECAYEQAQKEDPQRCQKHKSTKAKDDRTILIARF
ncbi:MAG: hypothetical protein AABY13_04770 [Nanoarchaeota archaeon]